jgi:pimeloyl-ACP methyl ester carboxylesterase
LPGLVIPSFFWLIVDDITEICQALSINHFSLLGHSLGATYALAVALRLPEKIRGQVHLLAPWIPLSQVTAATAMFDDISMDSSVMSFPATHRFLRVLPVPIIKVAGSFLREKEYDGKSNGMTSPRENKRSNSITTRRNTMNGDTKEDILTLDPPPIGENDLVAGIWAAATRNSNATIDLLTSLERPYTVGFTYFDVTLPVVIRHGSKDERVPLERVMWMTKAMNMARMDNAELKVIQGAQHGLMARADVMSDVFEEIARESHRWDGCVRCRKGGGCWLASNIKDAPPVLAKDRLRV